MRERWTRQELDAAVMADHSWTGGQQHGSNKRRSGPMPWAEQAACKGQSADMFPDPKNANGIIKSLSYCVRCPVRVPCLLHALDNEETYGTWGAIPERLRLSLVSGKTRTQLVRMVRHLRTSDEQLATWWQMAQEGK